MIIFLNHPVPVTIFIFAFVYYTCILSVIHLPKKKRHTINKSKDEFD